MEKTAEGVYRVTCASGLADSYKETFSQLGLSYVKTEESIVLTLAGERLVKMESTATVSGYFMQDGTKYDAVMIVHSVVTYK